MFIEELLDEIITTVGEGFKLKLFHRNIVDGDRIVNITNEVKGHLPPEFESAKKITENRNRIIESTEKWASATKDKAEKDALETVKNAQNQASDIVSGAKNDAAKIINDARLQAEQLISRDNITREANERAAALHDKTVKECDAMVLDAKTRCNEMTADARSWSNNLKDGAYRYAIDLINDVDGYLSDTSKSLYELKVKVESNQPKEM